MVYIHSEDCSRRAFCEEGGGSGVDSPNVILHPSSIMKAENSFFCCKFVK